MNYDDNIGKNIREVRLEKKLSQEELARKCGFSNTTLSAYENSRKILSSNAGNPVFIRKPPHLGKFEI